MAHGQVKDGFDQHYRLKRLRKADEVLAEVSLSLPSSLLPSVVILMGFSLRL
jgi:hypothetical protein